MSLSRISMDDDSVSPFLIVSVPIVPVDVFDRSAFFILIA